MELIIAVAILVVLAVLALRFGYDSRDGIPTEERKLARRGTTWDDLHADSPPDRRRARQRRSGAEPGSSGGSMRVED